MTAAYEAAVRAALAEADAWNALWPLGTPVNVTLDDGRVHYARTRARAAELYGRAVVWVTGRDGYFLLARVTPAPTAVPAPRKEARP